LIRETRKEAEKSFLFLKFCVFGVFIPRYPALHPTGRTVVRSKMLQAF
jgi:hypothetical protein